MAQTISVTGLSANNVSPGVFIDLQFAQGGIPGDASTKKILLVGQQISGSGGVENQVYGPDTATSISSLNDVKNLFGSGSELAVMYDYATQTNGGVNPIYCLVEPVFAAGTAATKTITFTGTATATSTVRLYMGDKFTDVAIDIGDTPTVLSGKCIAAINQLQTLVVASGTATVVVTYRSKCARGNQFKIAAQIRSSCGVTSDAQSFTYLASGAGEPVLTTAISNLTDNYWCIATAAGFADQTAITAFKAYLVDQATPVKNNRQRLFMAYTGDYSTDLTNRATWINALNNERMECISMHKSDYHPLMLSSIAAGAFTQFESLAIPRCNFNGFGSTSPDSAYWPVHANFDGSKPTNAQIAADLNAGVTPIKTVGTATQIVKRCTTRNILVGTTPDYRIREPHKVTVSDVFVSDLQAILFAMMQGKMIADNPVAGSVPLANTVYPALIRSKIIALLRQYFDNALVENVKKSIDDLIIQRSNVNSSRFEIKLNLDVADICDQIVGIVGQVG